MICLNECFQCIPSKVRSQLLAVDISNLLLCISKLLPSICENAGELIGLCSDYSNKMLKDIHTKCQMLLNCFIIREAPLDNLYKVSRISLLPSEMF